MRTFFDELNELERKLLFMALDLNVDVFEETDWTIYDAPDDEEDFERSSIAQAVLIYRRHGGVIEPDFCRRLKALGPYHFRDCFRDYSRIDDGVVMVQLPWMENELVNIKLGKEIVSAGRTAVSYDGQAEEAAFLLYDEADKAIIREECLEQEDYCNKSLRRMIEQYNEGRRNK